MKIFLISLGSIVFVIAIVIIVITCGVARLERWREENEQKEDD